MGEIEAVVSATGREPPSLAKLRRWWRRRRAGADFQKAVLKIGYSLIVIAVVLVVLILGVAVSRGNRFTTTLQFALVLTVAAIPVAMPTVLWADHGRRCPPTCTQAGNRSVSPACGHRRNGGMQ